MLTQRLLAHVPCCCKRTTAPGWHHRPGQRRHAGERAPPPDRTRRHHRDLARGRRRLGVFRGGIGERCQDPRTRLVLGDGRTHISLPRRRYDVLISEPSNPWIAGVAALFTREFFAAGQPTAPGGLMCQWAHTYDISDADLRSIVATFVRCLRIRDALDRRRRRHPAPRVSGADRAAPGGHFHGLAAARSRRGPSHRWNAGAVRIALALRRRTQRDVAIRGWRQRSRPTTGRRSNSPGRLPSSPASRPITPPRSAVCSTEGNKPPAVARALTGATASQWRDRGAMLMDAGCC